MTEPKRKDRVFLVCNASKPEAVAASKHLITWLESRGCLAGADMDGGLEEIRASKPDFVAALGGDGTILHTGQCMQQDQLPIIGINLGKLGYLANFDVGEFQECFDEIVSRPELICQRMMLDVRIALPGGNRWCGVALNDCVIRVGDPFRTVKLEIKIDEYHLCSLTGDGVILATPTGSTAHNMSCGGPLVEPGINSIIVTPKCPHSFTHRPLVVSPESVISIHLPIGSHGAAAVLDGQSVRGLPAGTNIDAHRSNAVFQIVRHPRRSGWESLITKLKWGLDVT